MSVANVNTPDITGQAYALVTDTAHNIKTGATDIAKGVKAGLGLDDIMTAVLKVNNNTADGTIDKFYGTDWDGKQNELQALINEYKELNCFSSYACQPCVQNMYEIFKPWLEEKGIYWIKFEAEFNCGTNPYTRSYLCKYLDEAFSNDGRSGKQR